MRLSRVRAFGERGVTLKFPSRSWSGVRPDDGAVILAMRARDMRTDRHGSRCVLVGKNSRTMDPAAAEETLRHCRLAERHGKAEGLLAYGDDAIDPNIVLSIRVVRRGAEYLAEIRP